MKKALLIFITAMAFTMNAMGQANTKKSTDELNTEKIAKATEFSIPTSGAFTLLGSNPANVSTPGFTKDIKVDYFLDDFSLKPNIAFEFQPVWLFGFKNVSLDDYRKQSSIVRLLSTANVSIGTLTKDGVSKLAYSIKLSFFKDPMNDDAYLKGIDTILGKAREKRESEEISKGVRLQFINNKITDLWAAIKSVKKLNDSAERELKILKSDPVKYDDQIRKLNLLISNNVSDTLRYHVTINSDSLEIGKITASNTAADDGYNESLKQEVVDFAKKYKEQNWYKPKVDIGAGKVDTYKNASLTQLGLKSNGYGIWANPSFGFTTGKSTPLSEPAKILITGLFKYVDSEGAGQKFYGGNIRYGSSMLNLFAEYTFLKDGSEETNSLAYGGSYTIGSKKLIEFGIRTDYTRDFSFKSLIPVIAFNWKLGQDLFN